MNFSTTFQSLLIEQFGDASEMVFTYQYMFRQVIFCSFNGITVEEYLCRLLKRAKSRGEARILLRLAHTLCVSRYRTRCFGLCCERQRFFMSLCSISYRLEMKRGCMEKKVEAIRTCVRRTIPRSRNPIARLRRELMEMQAYDIWPNECFDMMEPDDIFSFKALASYSEDVLSANAKAVEKELEAYKEKYPSFSVSLLDLKENFRYKLLQEKLKKMGHSNVTQDELAEILNRVEEIPMTLDDIPEFGKIEKMQHTSQVVYSKAKKLLNQAFSGTPIDNIEYYISLCEDINFFLNSMLTYNSRKKKWEWRLFFATRMWIKLRHKCSFFSRRFFKLFMDDISRMRMQSEDSSDLGSWLDLLNKVRDRFDEVRKSPVFEKFYKIIMYLMSFSVCTAVGGVFTKEWFESIMRERRDFSSIGDFISFLIDSIIFIVQRVSRCISTRSIDPLLNNGSAYEQWYEECRTLKLQSKFVNDPEPHGFTYYDFVQRLNDTIDRGTAMYKHAMAIKHYDAKLVGQLLFDLKLIKGLTLTRDNASEERKAPFPICLVGDSSIAKSTFAKLVFYHHGKLLNLPIGSKFLFTRNAENEYWDTFRSSQWAVLLDDVACQHPNKVMGMDKSLSEIILMFNNVTFVPPQAALEDKGTTPVRPKLGIATTNIEHLNAHAYFSHPIAIRRIS